MAALALFHRVTGLVLRGAAQPVALALFATAPPLIVYSAQAKQYSSDVAVALLILWLALKIRDLGPTPARLRSAAAVGALASWFSQPALFVLAGVSLALLWDTWQKRSKAGLRALFPLLPMIATWGLSALLVLVLEQRLVSAAQHEYLHRFWASGFMPTGSVLAAMKWLLRALRGIFFGDGCGLPTLPHSFGLRGPDWARHLVALAT
ncbi:MAG: hypothetical protein WDO74_30805 [Pseudomonadota bacterium]